MTLSVLVVSDGRAGHLNQSVGLASRLGAVPEIIESAPLPALAYPPLRTLFGWNWRWRGWQDLALRRLSRPLPEVAPQLLIACGGRTALPALALKARYGCQLVQIQDPRLPLQGFDLVVLPAHDRRSGDNILATLGALTRVHKAVLEAAAQSFQGITEPLPQPRVAVLLGGNSRAHRFTAADGARIGAQLAALARDGAGLMITASRRTPEDVAAQIRAALPEAGVVWWNGTGANPYLAFLAAADHILVTEDSVSMLSEAVAAGPPTMLLPLSGGSAKFRRLHSALLAGGHVRRFEGRLESWPRPGLDETGRVADRVRALLDLA